MYAKWIATCLTAAIVGAVPIGDFAIAAPPYVAPQKRLFKIPAQPLKDALYALSEQSGLRILFPYDDVAGLRSRPLRGWMTVEQALARLISNTPLKLAMVRDGMIALSGPSPRNTIARRPGIAQFAQASGSSREGDAALVAMLPTAAPEAAQSAEPSELIVTGTRQINRTVADSMAPIDVLSAAELKTSGKQSVRDLLGTLVPSISVSNGGAGASFAVKTLSLRGLSGDQLLVLVNGKRRHNTATLFINGTTQNGQSPPDFDLIPASAIERIEVLRDGASAQYGSDAIAGVINLILKKDAAGGSASSLIGKTFGGDGDTGQLLGDFGLPLGDGGHLHIAADGRLQDRTDRGGPNGSKFYFDIAPGVPDPREATVNRFVNHPGQPEVALLNLSYDAALPISDTVQLYGFATASRRHSNAWLTFRNPNASNNIPEIFPEGYSPRLHIHDRDYQVAVGLKGDDLEGFGWDLSTTYSDNRVRYRETTVLNVSLGPASPTELYIGRVGATEWTSNVDLKKEFGIGLVEPLFVAIGAEYRENRYEIGAGEPASYIDGGYRTLPGQPFAGVPRQPGSQGVTGFPPDAAGKFSRHSWGGYVNAEQTVVKGFDLAFAGRYERYSDAGSTTTGKISTRFEPVSGIAVRGTASTGFRAPTLQQQHYASSSTIGVILPPSTTLQLYPVRALPVDSAAAIALGATPLKPEKSTNFSAGLVFTAIPRLNVTVDAYQIDIDNRILLSGILIDNARSGGAVRAAFIAAGLDPNQGGFYFSNAADTRTRGLDIVATYRAALGGFGAATFHLSGNFNKTRFRHVDLPPAALANAGLTLIDRARQGDFTKGTPRNKFIGSVNWSLDGFSLNMRATRYGEVTMVSNVPANDDVIEPKVIFDLDIGYELRRGVKISVGADNLFNTYPTVLKPANQGVTGFLYYNAYSPYGISGGFYYARLGLTF